VTLDVLVGLALWVVLGVVLRTGARRRPTAQGATRRPTTKPPSTPPPPRRSRPPVGAGSQVRPRLLLVEGGACGATLRLVTPLSRRRRDDEWCKHCDRAVVIGFRVDDHVWARVVGDEDTACCALCFDELAQDKGVRFAFLDVWPIPWSLEVDHG
jgi:hypothetical protein